MTPLSLISLFSGAGGLDLGLERTGRFALRACVEKDPSCCNTIRANHAAGRLGIREMQVYEEDVAALDPHAVLRSGELDLLAGGPPCQPFSILGKRLGLADDRSLLLWQFIWWVEALKPRVFVLENVRGLLSVPDRPGGRQGSLMQAFVSDLPREYRLDVVLVDAADYGVPQHRRRVFLIGHRLARKLRFPRPTHGPRLLPYRTLADALSGLADPNPVLRDFTARRKAVFAQIPAGGDWRDLPDEVARREMGKAFAEDRGRSSLYRRLAWDRPTPTVVTAPDNIGSSLCHPDVPRTLTVRECARLQQFPDDWIICGKTAEQYRQVGNAVPVGLAEVVGWAVASLIDKGSCRDSHFRS